MKEVMIRVGLVLGSLALMVVVLEVGLRLGTQTSWRSTGFSSAFQSPKRADLRGRGFDVDLLAKREGTFRILVVGDSFTWGSGVHPEDAYPDRLGRRLGRFEADREIEVINWSKRGWNTAQEWRSLEGRLDQLEPDLLILGYCLNDPQPDRIRLDLRMSLERRRPRSGLGIWTYERSRVFQLVYGRFENTRQRRASLDYYTGLYEEDAPGRAAQLETFAKWKNEMLRRRIPMVLVIFPIFDSQLDSSYLYAHLHEQMTDLGRELEIPVLDLLPTYAGVDGRRLAVEPFTDSHPNELAHRMATDAILESLLEQQLLPIQSPGSLRGSSR